MAIYQTDALAVKKTMPVGAMPAPRAQAVEQMDADRAAQYDAQRQRAQQLGQAQKQQNNEAMRRRFAAIGNLGSGAYIKAASQADQESDANTNAAVQTITQTQENEKYAQNEAEKGRLFNKELFDSDQKFKTMVFNDESKARWADLNESIKANKANVQQAFANMSDEQLRALGGASNEWGVAGNRANINAILRRLGYA